jgi:AraC-like DNA-binding protein
MNFEKSDGGKPIRTGNKVPPHLLWLTIPFSQAIYKLYEEGEYLRQVILGLDYSVWIHHWNFKQPVNMDVFSSTDALALNYMIKGNVDCTLTGYGDILLKENKYRLYYVPANIAHRARFKAGTFLCIHINFHPSHFIPIAEQYPFFHPMLEQAQQQIKQGSIQHEATITEYMHTLLDEIIHCELGIGERTLTIESNIRQLLKLYIHDMNGDRKLPPITSSQEQLIKKLEEYIMTHLDEKINVDKLAKQMGVSRSWLQRIVQRKYGKGVHDLVTDKRMNEAARLLLTTKLPVSEIGQRVSTLTFSSFSARFSEYFQQTPSEYRKSGGQKKQK